MDQYKYKGIPLTPSIAREHILKYERLHLSSAPFKRSELVTYAAEQHQSGGGIIKGDPTGSVKKALNRLEEEGKIVRNAVGWYSPPQEEGGSDTIDTSKELLEPEEQDGVRGLLVPNETIGEGDELVYIYYQVSERKWAEHEGRIFWPCKIGFTAGDLTARIFGQFSATGMARLPVVGLVIRTDDGRGLERAIHFALDQAEARIDEAVGAEWFNTSPDSVRAWYEAHVVAVDKLRARK